MKRLLPIVAATLTMIIAAPVAAQPLEIIVRGGTPTILPTLLPDGDDYNLRQRAESELPELRSGRGRHQRGTGDPSEVAPAGPTTCGW